MGLILPDGEECFWDNTLQCGGGWHGEYLCDHDGCECPEGFGHRSPEGMAQTEADRKAKREADEREWASYPSAPEVPKDGAR